MIFKAKMNREFVVDLEGNPIERPKRAKDGTIGVDMVTTWGDLATCCANAQKKDSAKCYALAMRFHEKRAFDIDKSDKELLIQLVKEAGFSAILEAQLIEEIDSWKEIPAGKEK